jgi:hypothetical protein
VQLPGFSLFFFPFAIRTQLRLDVQLGSSTDWARRRIATAGFFLSNK